MRKFIPLLSIIFVFSIKIGFAQKRIGDILQTQTKTAFDLSKFIKKSDSIYSKMSFFGLSLINELDELVYNELNKNELFSENRNVSKNIDNATFQSVLNGYTIPDSIKRKYVLKDIASITHVGMFILTRDLNINKKLSNLRAKISFSKENIITAYVPIDQIKNVLSIPEIEFIETAIPVKQNLDQARKMTNVDQLNSGFQLPKGYTGKNVLIGIIDGGFDFGHPAFYDSLGNYRVHSIWNQNDNSGISPQNFNYGSEEKVAADIIARKTDNIAYSHGTHVAGITSGANWSTTQKYKGVAYDSKLVMVTFTGDLNNLGVFDGIYYTYQNAINLGVPSVVNLSLGSHIGPHDGTSLFDKACDILLEKGENKILTVVGAAGNEGNLPIHISKRFSNTDTSVSSFIRFSDQACGTPCFGVNGIGVIDLWGVVNANFSVRVGIFNKLLNQIEYLSPVLSTADNWDYFSYSLSNGVDVFRVLTRNNEAINSKSHSTIAINSLHLNSNEKQVFINIIGKNTEVHAWATPEYYVKFSDENLGFSDVINGNSDYSVGEIGGVGNSIISVGSFNSAYTSETIGDRSSFSSYGPTIDNRLKPEITAPGNLIASSVNSYDQNYISGLKNNEIVGSYDFAGRRYNYALMRGTSMSTPIVSGITALWKEASPFISTNQIKNVITSTAIKDQFTGSIVNKYWGHGKIDAYAGMKYILTQMPDKPKLTISGDTIICNYNKISVSAPSGFKSYLWNTGDTTRSITVDVEGQYMVIVQNEKGWWSNYSDTLKVFIDQTQAILSRFKPNTCLNSIYLKSNLITGQSISWYSNDTLISGANSQQFIPQKSGVYKIKIQDDLTKCFDVSDTLIIDMSKYNNRLFNSDSIVTCSLDSIELDAGSGFKSYIWNTGAKTQKIKVGKTGWYSARVNCGEDIVNFGYLNFPSNSPNSSRSYLSIPNAGHINFKDEMSILMNINIGPILSSRPTLLNKGSDSSYQIYLNWPMLTFSYPGMDRREGISARVPQNEWFSVAIVKNKDSAYLYFNGTIVDRAPARTPIPASGQPITIGKRAGVDFDYFVGGIDQLSLWNRSLSQEEVKNYINCTNGMDDGCVGFYNFDPTSNDLSLFQNNATYFNSAVGGWLGIYGTTPFTICSGSKSTSDSIYVKYDTINTGKTSFSFDSRCLDQSITFKNLSDTSKSFPLQWKWNMGDDISYSSSNVNHVYKKTGTYNVKLSLTSTSCPKFKDSIVKQIVISAPTKSERYKHINAKKGTETSVLARDFGILYKWKPTTLVLDSLSKSTKAIIDKETDFKIYITDNAGCTTIDSQLVRIFDKYNVFVPSAFSPDGNGINDRLRPIIVGIRDIKSFRIYSRWGNLLFSTKDISLGWDGKYKGAILPVDTYTWVFEGVDEDGKSIIVSGKTTLIL
jgi:minor extracellular serine protease Vpr